jgi:hypothetical protein
MDGTTLEHLHVSSGDDLNRCRTCGKIAVPAGPEDDAR